MVASLEASNVFFVFVALGGNGGQWTLKGPIPPRMLTLAPRKDSAYC